MKLKLSRFISAAILFSSLLGLIADNGELRVGISPIFPPMVFKQDKQLMGVEIDLANDLAQELGRTVTFVEVPWEDQIESLNAGKIDIIMSSMSVTGARKWVVDFSRPYLYIGQMVLVRREDVNKYALGFPLTPRGTVGVLKATTGDFLVQREFPKTKRTVYKTPAEAVQALKKKKIDLFLSDSTLVCYLAGTHAAENLSAAPVQLNEESLAWAVRKGDEKLLNEINAFIKRVGSSGKLNQVFQRWMAVPQ